MKLHQSSYSRGSKFTETRILNQLHGTWKPIFYGPAAPAVAGGGAELVGGPQTSGKQFLKYIFDFPPL